MSECGRKVRNENEAHVAHRRETTLETRPSTRLADQNIDNELIRHAQAGRVRLGAGNQPEAYISTSVKLPDGTVETLLSESRGEQ